MAMRDDRPAGQEPRAPHAVPALFIEALLRNPFRSRIMELLDERPGMNKNQLAAELGIYPNALEFHMDRLREVGLVEVRTSPRGREVVCFRREDIDLWENPHTRILFGRSPVGQVAVYLARHPGAETDQIARALGLSTVTVRHHIRTLQEHELIQSLRIGRQVLYHPEPELEHLMERVGDELARLRLP